MATHKQAMKRHLQNIKRRERNKHVKSSVRTRVKKVYDAVGSGKKGDAAETLKEAQSFLMDAGRKRVLHPRTAARKISRLAKKINAMQG